MSSVKSGATRRAGSNVAPPSTERATWIESTLGSIEPKTLNRTSNAPSGRTTGKAPLPRSSGDSTGAVTGADHVTPAVGRTAGAELTRHDVEVDEM